MTVKYKPVGWNANKLVYDAFMLAAITIYIFGFIKWAPKISPAAAAVDEPIMRIRAFGSCAFLMLTFVLCIGPLARFFPAWLPVLYNRRHFGVMTAAVAAAHLSFVLDYYASLSPVRPIVAVMSVNPSIMQLQGFPFEWLGLFTLGVLIVLAATSHDFWLSFLGPSLWKSIHMLIYPAFVAVTAHVALGALQATTHPALAAMALFSAFAVAGLHFAAARKDDAFERDHPLPQAADWIDGGDPQTIPNNKARVVAMPDGSYVALFRSDGMLSAVANACAHQKGPIGEGQICKGLVTCPWHGYQYRPEDGCSPPPYTERIATYPIKMENGRVFVSRAPNPLGTHTAALRVS